MNSEDNVNIDDGNLLRSFSYELWAPKELQQLYPELESALAQLETDNPSLEAAFVLFWRLMDNGNPELSDPVLLETDGIDVAWLERTLKDKPELFTNEFRQGLESYNQEKQGLFLDRLEVLLHRLRPQTDPDEPVLEREVILFAHMSASFALYLERLDQARTGKFWEIIDDALALLARRRLAGEPYWGEETEFSLDLSTSFRLLEAWMWAKLFDRYITTDKYENALECLYKASKLIGEADKELYDCLDAPLRIDDWSLLSSGREMGMVGDTWIEAGPGIQATGAGFHLVSLLVPAQQAVDALDSLIERGSDDARWQSIWTWSHFIQEIWEEPTPSPNVRSKSSLFEETARDYWQRAKGLVFQRVSPGDVPKVLEKMREQEIEHRLALYFFPAPLWSRIPEKGRQALVSADREYEYTGGRRAIIFNHLRDVVHEILAGVVWKPYRKEIGSRSVVLSLADLRAPAYDEPDLKPMLDVWKSPEFGHFLRRHFGDADSNFLLDIERDLLHLNYLANAESHEHKMSLANSRRRSISSTASS